MRIFFFLSRLFPALFFAGSAFDKARISTEEEREKTSQKFVRSSVVGAVSLLLLVRPSVVVACPPPPPPRQAKREGDISPPNLLLLHYCTTELNILTQQLWPLFATLPKAEEEEEGEIFPLCYKLFAAVFCERHSPCYPPSHIFLPFPLFFGRKKDAFLPGPFCGMRVIRTHAVLQRELCVRRHSLGERSHITQESSHGFFVVAVRVAVVDVLWGRRQ